jgi:hypothetical protein
MHRLPPETAGELMMKAWRCIHFSLVAYDRQFYNTLSAMQCCSGVRMPATYIESSESVRDDPVIGQPFCMDRTCKLAGVGRLGRAQ